MLTASTVLSALSCVLTSVLYLQNECVGDQLLERVFEKIAEEAEKQAESSHLRRSYVCKCAAVDPAPLVLGGIVLGLCTLLVGIWLGRRCSGRAPARIAACAPALPERGGSVPAPLPLEAPAAARKARRFVTPSSLSSSSAE